MNSLSQEQSYFKDKHVFFFGFGYVAAFVAMKLETLGCKISGTTTNKEKKEFMEARGYNSYLFSRNRMIPDILSVMSDVTHIVLAIPPDGEGDLVFDMYANDLAYIKNLQWIGYLSATSIYGDHEGAWVNEDTVPSPTSRRGSLRLKAEEDWKSYYSSDNLPLHIFRLAGIYGPGRSALDSVLSGVAKRIDKPGHVFNRIHIDDIVQTLVASMMQPNPFSIYNLSDDDPAPSHELIQYTCNLLGLETPPLVPFTQTDIAPIMRSFYKDNKRLRNDKIKDELGIKLLYPDYKSGLRACMDVKPEIMDILKFS